MTRVQKCRSKNRNPNGGGCGDPQCPEGRNRDIDEAVRFVDLSAYVAAREALEEETPLPPLSLPSGSTRPTRNLALPGASPRERIAKIDQTHIPSYPDAASLEEGLNTLYRGYGSVTLILVKEQGLQFVEVEWMEVKKEFRGLGVGRHMRACILKFGDENNYPVAGTPTPAGDGTVSQEHQEDCSANRLSHRKRLEKFYLDSGYEYNYGYYQKRDELTGKDLPQNPEWVEQFNPAAKAVLWTGGTYMKWPNGVIPASWMRA